MKKTHTCLFQTICQICLVAWVTQWIVTCHYDFLFFGSCNQSSKNVMSKSDLCVLWNTSCIFKFICSILSGTNIDSCKYVSRERICNLFLINTICIVFIRCHVQWWMDGLHDWIRCTNGEPWYPKHECGNADIFSCPEGLTFNTSAGAKPWLAAQESTDTCSCTHVMFIHLLIMLNGAPEVWTSQHVWITLLLIYGGKSTHR